MPKKPLLHDPKKTNVFYSGKKTRHTIKSQVVVNKETKEIICTLLTNGKRHDFRLFKESKVRAQKSTWILTDTSYQGLKKIHANTKMPKKKSKKRPLTQADKSKNRELSSSRVVNENVIGCIKRFKIISDPYRNRRKRFGLRFNFWNLQLGA